MNWLQKLVGAKTEEVVDGEIEGEPTIRQARKALSRVDAILMEYEKVERERRAKKLLERA